MTILQSGRMKPWCVPTHRYRQTAVEVSTAPPFSKTSVQIALGNPSEARYPVTCGVNQSGLRRYFNFLFYNFESKRVEEIPIQNL